MLKYLILLILLTNCASKTYRLPSKEFLQQTKLNSKKILSKEELNKMSMYKRQAYLYLKSHQLELQKNLKKACQFYTRLSQDKKFPLRELAKIRKLTPCFTNLKKITSWWKKNDSNFNNYLAREYLEVSLNLAKKSKAPYYIAIFSYRLAKIKQWRNEKIILLKQAFKYAKKTKNIQLINKIKKYLFKFSPNPNPRKDQLYLTARNFDRNRNFSSSRKIYKKIIYRKGHNLKEKIQAYYRYAMTYKLERNKELYLRELNNIFKWLNKIYKSTKNPLALEKWYEFRIKHARALWTINHTNVSKSNLIQLSKEKINHPNLMTEIYWLLANIALEKKEFNEAISYLKTAAKIKEISPKIRDQIFWSLGWNYYLLKKYDMAVKIFKNNIQETKNIYVERKLKFWLGKTYLLNKQKSKSLRVLNNLISEDQYGYYGIIARIELRKKIPPIKKTKKILKVNNPTLNWLISLEEFEVSKDYLKKLQKKYSKNSELLFPYYKLTKWYNGGMLQFFKLSPKKREKVLEKHIELAFPTPYSDEINAVARKYNIPSAFIYSVIRQESAFNHTARSWADAFGLMQLLPQKAKSISREAKIPYKNSKDLYDASKNIKLGSFLLKQLSKKLNNNFIGIIGSYNAGLNVTKKWIEQRFREDPIEFIEMIPYEETNTYIKLIYRNYITYQRIFEKNKIYLSKEFFRHSQLPK